MTRYVARRLVLAALTLLAVSIVVFAATEALPGDAARAILGNTATPDRIKIVRAQLHLDRPLLDQYWTWFSGAVRGDFGQSLIAQEPVTKLIGDHVVNSAVLIGIAALVAFPLSMLIGGFAAYRRDSAFDHIVGALSLALAALPEFIIAVLLVLLLSTTVLHLLPAISFIQPDVPLWQQPLGLMLPILTLTLWELPYVSRMMRASMIEVLESDYVEMARLKGLPDRTILIRHALPNAMVPIIQVVTSQLAFLVGGVVVVEFVFNYPGIGQAFFSAVTGRDLPVIQALALLIAALYVGLNLLADVLTILVSPRLRTTHVGRAPAEGVSRPASSVGSGS
jgi:peptide/nickel transport system permease protein